MGVEISEKKPLNIKLLVPAFAVVVGLIALIFLTTTLTSSGGPNIDKGDAKVDDIPDRNARAVLREDEGAFIDDGPTTSRGFGGSAKSDGLAFDGGSTKNNGSVFDGGSTNSDVFPDSDEEDEIVIEFEILGDDFDEEDFTFEKLEAMLEENPERFTIYFDPDVAVNNFDLTPLPDVEDFLNGKFTIPTPPQQGGENGGEKGGENGRENGGRNGGENGIFGDTFRGFGGGSRSGFGIGKREIRLLDYNETDCGLTMNTCDILAWIDGVSDATDDVLEQATCIFEYVEVLYEVQQNNLDFNELITDVYNVLPEIEKGLGAFTFLPYVGSYVRIGRDTAHTMYSVVKPTKEIDDKIAKLLEPVPPLHDTMDTLINVTDIFNVKMDTTEKNVNLVRLAVVDYCPGGIGQMESVSNDILKTLPPEVEEGMQAIADSYLAPVCNTLTTIEDVIFSLDNILPDLNKDLKPIEKALRTIIKPIISAFNSLLNHKFCAKFKMFGKKKKYCKKLKRIMSNFKKMFNKIKGQLERLVKSILYRLDINRNFLKLGWLTKSFNLFLPAFDLDFNLEYIMPNLELDYIGIENPCNK